MRFLPAGGDNTFGWLENCVSRLAVLPISITDQRISSDRGLHRTGARTNYIIGTDEQKKHNLMNYLIITACESGLYLSMEN